MVKKCKEATQLRTNWNLKSLFLLLLLYNFFSNTICTVVHGNNEGHCQFCDESKKLLASRYAQHHTKEIYQNFLKEIFCIANCPSEHGVNQKYVSQNRLDQTGKVQLKVIVCKSFCTQLSSEFVGISKNDKTCINISLPRFQSAIKDCIIEPYIIFSKDENCWNILSLRNRFRTGSAQANPQEHLGQHVKSHHILIENSQPIVSPMNIPPIPQTDVNPPISPSPAPLSDPIPLIPPTDSIPDLNNLNIPNQNSLVPTDLLPKSAPNTQIDGNGTLNSFSLNPSSTTDSEFKVVRTEFCFDECTCITYLVASIVLALAYIGLFCLSLYWAASLFSKGIFSSSLYKGGGEWILIAAAAGALAGTLTSVLTTYCPGISVLSPFSWMTIAYSVVLVGKRGALFGGLGGICFGLTLGYVINSSWISISVGALLGAMVGVILGFFPFARKLKINERYIRGGMTSQRLFEEDAPTEAGTRRHTVDVAETRKSSIASDKETRRATWNSPTQSPAPVSQYAKNKKKGLVITSDDTRSNSSEQK